MSKEQQYVMIAYAIGLGLMLGYGLMLWLEHRTIQRRQRRRKGA